MNKNKESYVSLLSREVRFSDIFSDVFKPHESGSVIRSLFSRSEHSRERIYEWQKPWIFFRIFAVLLGIAILLLLTSSMFWSTSTMCFIVGAMIIPITILTFIWEMDINRVVSAGNMLLLVVVGGVISMVLGASANMHFLKGKPVYLACLTEEPSKLLVCLLFILLCKKKLYCLDGLAIGAAVAAGFSFMETVDYAYNTKLGISLIVLRSIGNLFGGHILYTCPFVGALCYEMNGGRLRLKHLLSIRFLLYFALGILCHALHNTDFELLTLINTSWCYISLKDLLLGILNWGMFIHVFMDGVRQMGELAERSSLISRDDPVYSPKDDEQSSKSDSLPISPNPKKSAMWLQFGEQKIALKPNMTQVIGRGQEADIPVSSSGVSRRHCSVTLRDTIIEVEDLGSTNGTFINGRKLHPHETIFVRKGDVLSLSGRVFFEVES